MASSLPSSTLTEPEAPAELSAEALREATEAVADASNFFLDRNDRALRKYVEVTMTNLIRHTALPPALRDLLPDAFVNAVLALPVFVRTYGLIDGFEQLKRCRSAERKARLIKRHYIPDATETPAVQPAVQQGLVTPAPTAPATA